LLVINENINILPNIIPKRKNFPKMAQTDKMNFLFLGIETKKNK
jgi:hypothetical protein